jgi:choice-of-anchor B domain-containing protein
MRMTSTVLAAVVGLATAVPAASAQEPNFGRALASTDNELFVGQPVNWYGPGTVYTYRLDPSGQWRERGRVTASDTARMDDFGRAIAVDGNTMVIGAPRKRNGAGTAYVFERANPTAAWRQTAMIEPANTRMLGLSLALAGDDLLIGAPTTDTVGVVYHYRRTTGTWQLHATLRAPMTTALSGFGGAMSQLGDMLLVGASTADSNAGRVYQFQRTADGTWGAGTLLGLPRIAVPGGARAGTTVLLHGDRAYVGAPGSASVYVLDRDANGGLTPAGELHPFDAARGSNFGAAVAVVGTEVWVGAPGINSGNGRVYRFVADREEGWQSAARFDADSADGTHWPFGYGAAIVAAGNRVVVSMPSRDFGEGRVLVAARGASGWRAQQQLTGEIHKIGGAAARPAKCEQGKLGAFTCNNMELVSHLPVSELGGERGAWVNDVWGWTDPVTNRDYALVARRDGISFVDLTDPARPSLIGNLPRTVGSPPSVWRDIKVLSNHAYIVADGAGEHGMQVFDLTRLRGVRGSPATFAPDTTYRNIHSAHNVVADTASGFLYIVGANGGGETCGGGLHMVDARQPKRLSFAGCYNNRGGSANSRGYTHDGQCLQYRGPDARFTGRQICIGSNETEINIADVTDKANPIVIGRNSYPDVSYAHQGWFDDQQRYFYMNDEGDELAGVVKGTRTIVWDLAKLDDPVVANMYIGPVMASDHNLYVKGDRVFESNYGSGLRVLDISDRANPREIGFFDSAPTNDDGPGHSAAQSGAWSNYPFFKNGLVVFTSVREGLFVVKVMGPPTS